MMITITNLKKAFGNKVIFQDFQASFENGKVYGIKGSSGSGKSTLLNLLGLIDTDFTGDIILNEKNIQHLNKKEKVEILKTSIFYLFQNYALVDDKTVHENFKLILKINPDFQAFETKALESVGLDDTYLNMPIYTLSGGEQQRISLARAYLRDCNIILADEPTGNLDGENARKVLQILVEMSKENKIVIIATHDQQVLDACDEIITL